MTGDPYDLDRFVTAQAGTFDQALAELREGHKRSHWMWFVFPQHRGLGHSEASQFFGLSSLEEAAAFASHPILGSRLAKAVAAVEESGAPSLRALFGSPDDLKFRSSMTIFAIAAPNGPYRAALDRWCNGPDPRTLALIGRPGQSDLVMARKLKVFQSQFGFYDTVVAAPSQAAALRAWGTHQNLFAHGEAVLATDEAAIAAALEHPETPLRRAVGSSDPFRLEPTSLPKVPDAPKQASKRPPAPQKTAQPKPPPADRSALDAAEAALRKLDAARLEEEAEFRRQQDALDAAKLSAQNAYVQARKRATGRVVDTRKAYRAAGGKD